jgi:hypothetical protein
MDTLEPPRAEQSYPCKVENHLQWTAVHSVCYPRRTMKSQRMAETQFSLAGGVKKKAPLAVLRQTNPQFI